MKKLIALFLALVMMLSLCACGKMETASIEPSIIESKVTEEKDEDIPESSTIAETKPDISNDEKNNVRIDWLEKNYTYTDENGYIYSITIKVSPWILQSNNIVLNSAWECVGGNHTLPSENDWGLTKIGEDNYFYMDVNNCTFNVYGLSDFYYAVGTISINNTTDGWDFSESNTGTPKLTLINSNLHAADGIVYQQNAHIMSKVFYGEKVNTYAKVMHIDPLMKRNNWGPVPFVLAYAENFSPAYPNGQYKTELESLNLIFANPYTYKFDGAEEFHIQIYCDQ